MRSRSHDAGVENSPQGDRLGLRGGIVPDGIRKPLPRNTSSCAASCSGFQQVCVA
jgi:hypothetical protein